MSKLTACSLGALVLLLAIGGNPQAFAQNTPNEQLKGQAAAQGQPSTQSQKMAASRRMRGQQTTNQQQQIQQAIKQYVPQQYQQYIPGAAQGGGGLGAGTQ